MPLDELIGLLLLVALLSACFGALVVGLAMRRRDRSADSREGYLTGFGTWLAAHRQLGRASVSLVTAFRALALTSPESKNIELRRDQSQRCRAAWSDARTELDRAESMLVARTIDPGIRRELTDLEPGAPGAMQDAIDGSREELDAFRDAISNSQERADAFVLSQTRNLESATSKWQQIQSTAACYLRSLMDRGSRR